MDTHCVIEIASFKHSPREVLLEDGTTITIYTNDFNHFFCPTISKTKLNNCRTHWQAMQVVEAHYKKNNENLAKNWNYRKRWSDGCGAQYMCSGNMWYVANKSDMKVD